MFGGGGAKRRCKISGKVGVFWAAPMPKRKALRHVGEREHFFDAAVAVSGDDQNVTAEIWLGARYAHDQVVMKFALLPMIDQLVAAPATSHVFQQAAEHQRCRQLLHDCR